MSDESLTYGEKAVALTLLGSTIYVTERILTTLVRASARILFRM